MERREGEQVNRVIDLQGKLIANEMEAELLRRVISKWIDQSVVSQDKFNRDMTEVVKSEEYKLWLLNIVPVPGVYSQETRMKFLSEFLKKSRGES